MKKHLTTVLVALTVLGACGDGTGFGKVGFARSGAAPKVVSVSNNEVVIAGPKGFCIDPGQTRDTAKSSFVLLGSCAAISNSRRKPKPEVPAILMATVSAKTASIPITQSMGTLARFFKSSAGRAALSRDGRAQTVRVIETLGKGDIFYIHAIDTSTDTLAGAGDEYWRALFNVKGRIVSASVVGLEDKPIFSDAGFRTLDAFARQIIARNASGAVRPATKKTNLPLLKRLFGNR